MKRMRRKAAARISLHNAQTLRKTFNTMTITIGLDAWQSLPLCAIDISGQED